MSQWKEYKLGENCLKIGSGATPRGGADTYSDEGEFALVRSQNVLDYCFSYNGLAYINEVQAKKLNNVEVHEGDILLNITGDSVARVCQIPVELIPARVNQHVAIIRPKPDVLNTQYLKYYLLNPSFKEYMLMLGSSGATRNAITKGMIEDFIIKAPSIVEQTAIASILSSLDEKIGLNNAINRNLEALAQALFKQWFVEFNFPVDQHGNFSPLSGEMSEGQRGYKDSGGEMTESELGMIPKGWRVDNLEGISNINIGRTPPRKEHQWFTENDNDVKWISIKDMGNAGVYITSTSEYLTREAVKKFNIPIIKPNTVVVSFKLTVGRVSITTEAMLSNEAIAHINLKDDELSPEFIYLFLKQFDFDSLGSTSSIATAVNSKAIKALPFIYPNKSVHKSFSEIVKVLFETIKNNTNETVRLSTLRNTLLPKLISGELEVKDDSLTLE